jgi:hypothetical protein
MAEIAIIFHSGYGHTLRMAQAVAEGAKGQLIPIDAEGTLDGPKHIRRPRADEIRGPDSQRAFQWVH